MARLFVVYSGDKQRSVFRKLETAEMLVQGLNDADKYENCCYEPGFHHIRVFERE